MRSFTQLPAHGFAAMRPLSTTVVAALIAALAASPALSAQQTDSTRAAAAPGTNAQPASVMVDTTQASADSTTGRTHTVKKGDTLWDLAHLYLNDPFMWPEIYRINTTVVRDPHWIYPGQTLRIPGDVQNAVADQSEPRFEPTQVTANSGGPTVFKEDITKRLSASNSRFSQGPIEYAHTTVRVGEFYAAPWLDAKGGPASQGKVIAPAGIPGIAKTIAVATRLGPDSRMYVTLPSNVVAAKGDYLMLFQPGEVLQQGGQVMRPTAIVRVEATDNGGEATTVRIIKQFDEVLIGQGVLPLGQFNMSTETRPAPLALGPESRVIYVPSHAVLPSVQSYIILDATTRDGVKPGDQFTLYRAREKAPIPGTDQEVTLPEEPIALAQVVKVTDEGTTAIILDQRQPAIKVGVMARLTSRMP